MTTTRITGSAVLERIAPRLKAGGVVAFEASVREGGPGALNALLVPHGLVLWPRDALKGEWEVRAAQIPTTKPQPLTTKRQPEPPAPAPEVPQRVRIREEGEPNEWPTPWTASDEGEISAANGEFCALTGDPMANPEEQEVWLAQVIAHRVSVYRELVRLVHTAFTAPDVVEHADPRGPTWHGNWRDRAQAVLKQVEAMDSLGTLGGDDL